MSQESPGEDALTPEDIETAKQQLGELREQVREDLATLLGGDPEDYNADTYRVDEPVTDGGE